MYIMYIGTQIVIVNCNIADKLFNQYLQRNKQNLIDFMNDLYLKGLDEVKKMGRD